jgi:hypothetical protein
MQSDVVAGDGLGDRDVLDDGIGLGVPESAGEADGLGVESDFAFPTLEQPIRNTAPTMRQNSEIDSSLRISRRIDDKCAMVERRGQGTHSLKGLGLKSSAFGHRDSINLNLWGR